MSSPLVSVAIPVRDAVETVLDAVSSAIEQTHEPAEVLVVDDGSVDGSIDLIADRPGVRIVSTKAEGLGRARRVAHERAVGEWVCWLDADDLADPDRIAIQLEVASRMPDAIAVSGDFRMFDAAGPLPGSIRSIFERLAVGESLDALYGGFTPVDTPRGRLSAGIGNLADELPFGNFIHPPTLMVRREAALRVPASPRDLPISTDWLFFSKLSRLGPFAYVDTPLVSYRRSEKQVSASKNHLRIARDNLTAFEMIHDDRPDVEERWPTRVRRLRSEHHLAVASALVDADEPGWFRHLRASVSAGRPSRRHVIVGAKGVVPRPLLERYWRLKGVSTG